MGVIRWSLSLVILAMWCALVGTVLYVALYQAPEEIPQAGAIVVLGGNDDLEGQSLARFETGLALYQAGHARNLVVTGGGPDAVAPKMADAARAAGVPEGSLHMDDKARSTIQNALYTTDFDAIDPDAPVILVSHRFHLPRAWATFWWAGFSDIHLVAADPEGGLAWDVNLVFEAVKWPFNIVRAAAASGAEAGGVPREDYMKYLE